MKTPRNRKVPAVLQSVVKAIRHPATVISRRPLLKGDKDYTPRTKRYKIVIEGSRRVVEKLADDMEVYESLSTGHCPDCGHKEFTRIADGGGSELIACKHCKSRFVHGLPLFAERAKGFTLIELLIIIAIVALLAGILIPYIRHILGF